MNSIEWSVEQIFIALGFKAPVIKPIEKPPANARIAEAREKQKAMLSAFKDGLSLSEVSKLVDLNISTVTKWRTEFKRRGDL